MDEPARDLAHHWDAAYDRGTENVSWTQEEARVSLELIGELGVPPTAPVVDVGGGASPLAANLLDRGFTDVSVLDLSEHGLAAGRALLGARAGEVAWIVADVRDWAPPRRYGLWHDRAVLHFITDPAERRAYAARAADGVAPGGGIVIATFAPDGPDRCSGLPVRRSSPDELATLLGDAFTVVAARREEHRTPGGSIQPFTWIAGRRG